MVYRYPDWVFELANPLPTKEQLMSKAKTQGVETLSLYENNRLRRLMTLDAIVENNSSGNEAD